MSSVGSTRRRESAEVEELVAAFERGSLEPGRWTHAAHLAVALWYVRGYGREGAAGFMRTGIQHYNAVAGGSVSAYHETVTLAWIELVARFDAEDHARPLGEAVRALQAKYPESRFLERHWSRELLWSAEARAGWVPPDLAPL